MCTLILTLFFSFKNPIIPKVNVLESQWDLRTRESKKHISRLLTALLIAHCRRQKIAHDPNNTVWSRDTTSYGHKQLVSQGWAPGQNLGATHAPHKKLYSEASTSHIRVVLRNDNLGLGAKRGSGQLAGECTGLDSFQNLLGRLNGKSQDVLEKEQQGRNHAKRVMFVEKRWESLNFVSGGLLVGDKIWGKGEAAEEGNETSKHTSQKGEAPKEVVMITEPTPKARSKQKSKDKESKEERRARRKAKHTVERPLGEAKPIVESQGISAGIERESQDDDDGDSSLQQERRKEEKRLRKAKKAQRKLDKRRRKETEKATEESSVQSILLPTQTVVSSSSKITPTPMEPSRSPVPSTSNSGGRHAVRQRYIRQKQMAMLDPKALNEVNHHRAAQRRDKC